MKMNLNHMGQEYPVQVSISTIQFYHQEFIRMLIKHEADLFLKALIEALKNS
jgi:hypothetical protein